MDSAYAELEMGIHRVQADSFEVELRFINPSSANEYSRHGLLREAQKTARNSLFEPSRPFVG